MMITVINGNQDGFVGENRIYIGRHSHWKQLEKSPLHNPYKEGKDGNLNEVVDKYRHWLDEQIEQQSEAYQELVRIADLSRDEDIELSCWCFPLPCHGQVVKEAIERILN